MKWEKCDFHYRPDSLLGYAALPFILKQENGVKVFFHNRDEKNRSVIQSVDLSINGENITLLSENLEVMFKHGSSGNFDDAGVMGCHLSQIHDKSILYYVGWNISHAVPFRNAIGVAEFSNNSFSRIYKGPILDRSIYDPCMVASNCIIKKGDLYIMYYLSCDSWQKKNDSLMHNYNIKIAYSSDGITWDRKGEIAIDYLYENEYAISVPRVMEIDGIYKMWYSYRGGKVSDFYRIGYAESEDAIHWIRKDAELTSDLGQSDWDSEMQCYPYVFNWENEFYMIYNGNGYGKTGFGIAIKR